MNPDQKPEPIRTAIHTIKQSGWRYGGRRHFPGRGPHFKPGYSHWFHRQEADGTLTIMRLRESHLLRKTKTRRS